MRDYGRYQRVDEWEAAFLSKAGVDVQSGFLDREVLFAPEPWVSLLRAIVDAGAGNFHRRDVKQIRWQPVVTELIRQFRFDPELRDALRVWVSLGHTVSSFVFERLEEDETLQDLLQKALHT